MDIPRPAVARSGSPGDGPPLDTKARRTFRAPFFILFASSALPALYTAWVS
jgi:hypothetical protein